MFVLENMSENSLQNDQLCNTFSNPETTLSRENFRMLTSLDGVLLEDNVKFHGVLRFISSNKWHYFEEMILPSLNFMMCMSCEVENKIYDWLWLAYNRNFLCGQWGVEKGNAQISVAGNLHPELHSKL